MTKEELGMAYVIHSCILGKVEWVGGDEGEREKKGGKGEERKESWG